MTKILPIATINQKKSDSASGGDAKLEAIYDEKSKTLRAEIERFAAVFTNERPGGLGTGRICCRDFFMHPAFFSKNVQNVMKTRHYSTDAWKGIPEKFRTSGNLGFPLDAFDAAIDCIEGRDSPLLAEFIKGDPVFMGQLIEAIGKVLTKPVCTLDYAIRDTCRDIALQPLERLEVAGKERILIRSLSTADVVGVIREKYCGKLRVTLNAEMTSMNKIGSEVSRIRNADKAVTRYWNPVRHGVII